MLWNYFLSAQRTFHAYLRILSVGLGEYPLPSSVLRSNRDSIVAQNVWNHSQQKHHFPSLWNRNFPSNEQRMLEFLSLLRRAPSRNCRAVTLNFSVYKLPTNRRGPTVLHLFLKLFWRHASCKYSCCDVLSTEQSVFTSSELINATTWFVMALKQKKNVFVQNELKEKVLKLPYFHQKICVYAVKACSSQLIYQTYIAQSFEITCTFAANLLPFTAEKEKNNGLFLFVALRETDIDLKVNSKTFVQP